MTLSRNKAYWMAWLFMTLLLSSWIAYALLNESANRTIFMPGDLSPGHHQLAEACEACHTDSFGGGEVVQKACVECHGKDRVKPFDSHPAKKFKDPRNADLLEKVNALQCVTCHTEHKPEITEKNGVTQPQDVCFHCHQDIEKERPSHVGMDFDTCKDSGCHNFHNNRALYTDFLIKRMNEAPYLDEMRLPSKEFAELVEEIAEYPRDLYPLMRLDEDDIDATSELAADKDIKMDWLETAHARSGVNCSACHQVRQDEGGQAIWDSHPDHTVCENCHGMEVSRFQEGKHGMRLKLSLSPMTPARAQLPMKAESAHLELTCISCHGAHRFDVNEAAVDACLGCHDDRHSISYKSSPHYGLWQKEVGGDAEENTGVSCASCHMPRTNYDVSEWMSRIVVDHNQSASLSPNSKMLRSSCLHCHGLEFSLAALADDSMIEVNFHGEPGAVVKSMELARDEHTRRQQKSAEDEDADMFGF